MYEIWSVGHKPYEDYGNNDVKIKNVIASYIVIF